ncbi:HRDC domain-containing protein [Curtobacterium herbarum]|uniref:Ribonuclease D n=1 Tax=Curtobacterium herbarum TaxID=150122 RepID=A0ABN1ZG64_9MICO|nr:HRDC domain-containing protein [Curtobacterium herbarum]MBM7475585.1 ribonuclease D [Curtobacterium herbarum]MCS6543499.1 HRDC domain-containing protein [Curtobacterium herbarum]
MTDADPAYEDAHAAVHVIEERDEYLQAVARLAAGHGPVAVDAERASGYRYSQRAYLIQVFRRGSGSFLFDPIAIGDFSDLQAALVDEEWVFHAASQDLPCLREVGLVPTRIFDTELGARIAGFPRVGLGAVVEQLLGITLAKAHSAADWSTRPLPQAWLVYAALDVELLPDLRDSLAEVLESAGKARIAEEEFAAVLARAPKPPRVEPWRRLSGMNVLRGARALAIARSLWLARDAYAQETDIAPGRTIPDSAIVAAAAAAPTSRAELGALKSFTGRASRAELDRWWAAVEEGRTTEDLPRLRGGGEPSLPPPRAWAERNPAADRRYRAARAAVTARAAELDLPVENLLTPETLRLVSWTPPKTVATETVGATLASHDARPWQVEETASVIAHAFEVAADRSVEDPAAEVTATTASRPDDTTADANTLGATEDPDADVQAGDAALVADGQADDATGTTAS